jgi:hypothetical protein
MQSFNSMLKSFFFSQYETASFVVQQKAFIFMWLQVIVIPLMVVMLGINIFRNDPSELNMMIAIDLIIIIIMISGLVLMRRGAFEKAVIIEIYSTTILVIAGYIFKHHVVIHTGYNPFLAAMFASIAFIAMFGSRPVMISAGIMYLFMHIAGYLTVTKSVTAVMHFYLLSSTLIGGASLIVVWSSLYLISLIAERSLFITQEELQKNILLNRTLENQVEKRTEELKDSMNKVQVLGGLIPVCPSCNRIRDDKGYWLNLENYIRRLSDAELSHSICPECAGPSEDAR